MAKTWPEHEAFFKAVGKALERFGTPQVVGLGRDVVGYLLEKGLPPLVSGRVVVIPKFVAGNKVAPLATKTSWQLRLPQAVAFGYPQSTGILLTNSPMEKAPARDGFVIWGREELLRLGSDGYPELGRLVPGKNKVLSGAAVLSENLMPSGGGRVALPFATRIDPKGWVAPGPDEVFVVPVDSSGGVQGGVYRQRSDPRYSWVPQNISQHYHRSSPCAEKSTGDRPYCRDDCLYGR